MPTVAIGGSGQKVGKTSLICGLIAALPECPWTAVKITSHDHGLLEPVWEETQAGHGTDTARYLAAGARRALLVTKRNGEIPEAELRLALGEDHWLIFESNQVQTFHEPDVILALIAAGDTESKPSFAAVVQRADAFVCAGSGPGLTQLDGTRPVFVLPNLHPIAPELIAWLRARLALPPAAR
ncbi:MAG TPA: hypothetical protein VHW46_14190 [Terracidiphilus sp.]|jgi:hypothetical protein|nr:hypothetical protein [Terracidiphilus sp.]